MSGTGNFERFKGHYERQWRANPDVFDYAVCLLEEEILLKEPRCRGALWDFCYHKALVEQMARELGVLQPWRGWQKGWRRVNARTGFKGGKAALYRGLEQVIALCQYHSASLPTPATN
jgi:hypothetical protein